MSSRSAEIDEIFIARASNPDNYLQDNGLHRPPAVLGHEYGDKECPAMQATLFPVVFSGETEIEYLPWASYELFYNGDKSWSRITQSTHHQHIHEMKLRAPEHGYSYVDKPIFGYIRPLVRDVFTDFIFNTKNLSIQIDDQEKQALLRVTERMPTLTIAVGRILLKHGDLSEIPT